MHVCVGGRYTYDSVGTHKGLERELDSPGARVIDMSETPDTGAGNQTWVHTRAACLLNAGPFLQLFRLLFFLKQGALLNLELTISPVLSG